MKRLSATPPATWQQRYETLRQHSLERPPVLAAAPLGLVLVCRHGVAGWMRQWNPEESIGSRMTSTPSLALRPTALPGWQQQLTHLLAQIAMSHLLNQSLCLPNPK